eukprot:365387-Chlamydomonas_euryale.AAC.2
MWPWPRKALGACVATMPLPSPLSQPSTPGATTSLLFEPVATCTWVPCCGGWPPPLMMSLPPSARPPWVPACQLPGAVLPAADAGGACRLGADTIAAAIAAAASVAWQHGLSRTLGLLPVHENGASPWIACSHTHTAPTRSTQ